MKNSKSKKAIQSWVMYDWANSAFATTVMTVFMPVFYTGIAGQDLPNHLATAYWGYTLSIALLLAAILSPILGALADFRGTKKRYLAYFVLLGV
ncbi:MAG: MFS transporter, partial [Chloroflexi bacterium]|nr:MFS transporter [Chloroflexota bacterium]